MLHSTSLFALFSSFALHTYVVAVPHPSHLPSPVSPHMPKPIEPINYADRAFSTSKSTHSVELGSIPTFSLDINFNSSKPVSDLLWGVFFEDINHAGVGGLYAELINNYNFMQEDYGPWQIQTPKPGQAHRISLELDENYPASEKVWRSLKVTVKGVPAYERIEQIKLYEKGKEKQERSHDQAPLHRFVTSSVHEEEEEFLLAGYVAEAESDPSLGFGPQSSVGIYNPGYWGMNLTDQAVYSFSTYVRSDTITQFNVQLRGGLNNAVIYANQPILIPSAQAGPNGWTQVFANITASIPTSADPNGSFAIVFPDADLPPTGTQTINFVGISLMPQITYHGLPISLNLGEAIADLHPAFFRFPGGCYVEGNRLQNRFNWKHAIDARITRPGHWNLWNYYSEDGLGLYEYLAFIETLTNAQGHPTEAVWVFNNGIAHDDGVPTAHIDYWIQDALDSMEFAMGDENTQWGAKRIAMGHPAPFSINIVAIGNEDCGKDYYATNYLAFYNAFKQFYPHVRTIANCDLSPTPTDLWDYHVYENVDWFFDNQFTFDSYDRAGPTIFNSEYAVIRDCGEGNLWAALGEAAWMTGLERNSDIVQLASYAPLFVNDNDRNWNPDAIVFNSAGSFGTPSYWVQSLFANAQHDTLQGSQHLLDFMMTPRMGTIQTNVSVSVTAAKSSLNQDNVMIVKIVNYNYFPVHLQFTTSGIGQHMIASEAHIQILTSANVADENSFSTPKLIFPFESILQTASDNFSFTFDGYSVNVLRMYVKKE